MWGYYNACTLRPATLTRTEAGDWRLAGTIAQLDTFRAAQRPLTFVMPNGIRWAVLSLQITGASLTATLGPKE